jgi:hypothetical protein
MVEFRALCAVVVGVVFFLLREIPPRGCVYKLVWFGFGAFVVFVTLLFVSGAARP